MNKTLGMKSGIARTTVGLLVGLLLGGCIMTGVEQTVLPARIDYQCTGGRLLQVARSADGFAAAVLVDGKEVILQRSPSAAQEKYSNGSYTLYLDGERAMLEQDSTVLYGPCVATRPLPSAPRYR